jgi:hypothetical protein
MPNYSGIKKLIFFFKQYKLRIMFQLREDYFPLTLTLSPIGGEGKKIGPI